MAWASTACWSWENSEVSTICGRTWRLPSSPLTCTQKGPPPGCPSLGTTPTIRSGLCNSSNRRSGASEHSACTAFSQSQAMADALFSPFLTACTKSSLSAAHLRASATMARVHMERNDRRCGEGALSMLRITSNGVETSSSKGNSAPCPPGRFNTLPSSTLTQSPDGESAGVSVCGC